MNSRRNQNLPVEFREQIEQPDPMKVNFQVK